jgi:DNA invertase Pin-like site-specific DNA recombinase
MIYGYIRVSTDKQTTENQRFEIFKFADEKKLHIDRWIEETISATKGSVSKVEMTIFYTARPKA